MFLALSLKVSRLNASEVIEQNVQLAVLVNDSKTAWPTETLMPFCIIFWTICFKMLQFFKKKKKKKKKKTDDNWEILHKHANFRFGYPFLLRLQLHFIRMMLC